MSREMKQVEWVFNYFIKNCMFLHLSHPAWCSSGAYKFTKLENTDSTAMSILSFDMVIVSVG